MQVVKSNVAAPVDTVYSLGWQCEEIAAIQGVQHLPRASILWQVSAISTTSSSCIPHQVDALLPIGCHWSQLESFVVTIISPAK